jgi:microcystin-dependent protein
MHMRSIFTLILLTAATSFAWRSARAQTGIGTTTPDANAMLDIESTQKGVLMPSLTAAQQATLSAVLTPAEMGMLVRDAVTGKPIFWNGAAWKNASGATLTATPMLSVSSTNNIALNPGTAVGDLITWDGTNWINMQPAVQHFSLAVDNRQPFLTLNYCIALTGVFPSRSSDNPFLSEIELYAFSFPPKGFALCNGQLLSIAQNTALFSLMGTTYGGNGTSTFQLPNLQGRVPMHAGSNGTSNYVLGQTGGVESNTITR